MRTGQRGARICRAVVLAVAAGTSLAFVGPLPARAAAPLIGVSDASVVEGDAGATPTLSFQLTLSEASTSPVTVGYKTGTGDARGTIQGPRSVCDPTGAATPRTDADYVTSTGFASFAPGQTSVTLLVPVIPDDIPEGDETMGVQLCLPTGADLGDSEGTGTIVDDDAARAQLSIAGSAVAEGSPGDVPPHALTFTVSLSASTVPVEVRYAVLPASGASVVTSEDGDFVAVNGAMVFPPSASAQSRTFEVEIVPDADVEADEVVTAVLWDPVNADLAVASADGTILNDD